MTPIQICNPDPSWPAYFALFSRQLATYLNRASVTYISINHIGSTSVPHLAAKNTIDIVVLVADSTTAIQAREALIWEPDGPEYYRCIGDGGILGRLSMKFADWQRQPQRSVYIIAEDDENGMRGWRGYQDLRRVLKADEALRKEYEEVKWASIEAGIDTTVVYGRSKNAVVAKILRKAGWPDEEIAQKEGMDVRSESPPPWEEEGWPY